MPEFNDGAIHISIKWLWSSVRVLQAPEGCPPIIFYDWDNERMEIDENPTTGMSKADRSDVEEVFYADHQ